MAVRAIIYESNTGLSIGDSICAVYKFSDEEAMLHHLFQANIPNRVVSEITVEEYYELQEYDVDTNQLKNKVDVSKIRTYLKDRKKENYIVNIEGVSYQDKRPEKAIIKNKI